MSVNHGACPEESWLTLTLVTTPSRLRLRSPIHLKPDKHQTPGVHELSNKMAQITGTHEFELMIVVLTFTVWPAGWVSMNHILLEMPSIHLFNTLRLKQNGRHFTDDIFKCIFLNENEWILLKISLKFVVKGPINSIPALVQIMAGRRPGDKPLPEPMMISLPTYICVDRPQWVNPLRTGSCWMCNQILVSIVAVDDLVPGVAPNHQHAQ